MKGWRVGDRFVVVAPTAEWEVAPGTRGTVEWVGRKRVEGRLDGQEGELLFPFWPDEDEGEVRRLDVIERLAELAR